MAKAGFWLRGARGKLAGASLGKGANGTTVMREIVTPKNPQTVPQMIQRVIMKTVMQAYSSMKEITDHSFEGINPGQATMAEFQRVNLDFLRSAVMTDLANGGDANDIYCFTPLKSQQFAPMPYIVSKGSLPAVDVTLRDSSAYFVIGDNNTYGQVIERLGLQRGDQLTFVSIQGTTPVNTRFYVNRVILDPREQDGSEAPLDTQFCNGNEVVKPNPRNEGTFSTLSFNSVGGYIEFGHSLQSMTAAGVIVSRNENGNWRRSNCQLAWSTVNVTYYPSLGECIARATGEDVVFVTNRYLNQSGTGRTVNPEGGSAPAPGPTPVPPVPQPVFYRNIKLTGDRYIDVVCDVDGALIKVTVSNTPGYLTLSDDQYALLTTPADVAEIDAMNNHIDVDAAGDNTHFFFNIHNEEVEFNEGVIVPNPVLWNTNVAGSIVFTVVPNGEGGYSVVQSNKTVSFVSLSSPDDKPKVLCSDGVERPIVCKVSSSMFYDMQLVNGTIWSDEGAWDAFDVTSGQSFEVVGFEEPSAVGEEQAAFYYDNGISPKIWVRNG